MPLAKDLYKRLKWMTMSIHFLWCWELVIVTYNVWNKTPESIFQITEAIDVWHLRSTQVSLLFMGVGRGAGGQGSPGFWNLAFHITMLAKKVIFLVSGRKNEISSSLSPLEKILWLEKSANVIPLEKILQTPMLLLLFVGKMRGKNKTSLHCNQGCRYSMEQNVEYL